MDKINDYLREYKDSVSVKEFENFCSLLVKTNKVTESFIIKDLFGNYQRYTIESFKQALEVKKLTQKQQIEKIDNLLNLLNYFNEPQTTKKVLSVFKAQFETETKTFAVIEIKD